MITGRRLRVAGGLALALAVALGAWAAAAGPGPDAGTRPLLVSRQLGERLGLDVGDVVLLSADPESGGRPFRIAGIYEPMPDPMRFTSQRLEGRLRLPDLLALTADPADPLSGESVGTLNVRLADPALAEQFARDVSAQLPGLMATPADGGEDAGVFVILERFHLAIAVVTVLASTLFLMALMIMLVDERRQAVGILRLVGLPRARILRQVLVEGLLVAGAGTLFGLLLAATSQAPINHFFQWRYDTSLVFVDITFGIAWRSVLIALPLGVLASVAASWALLRRDVLDLAKR